MHLSSTVYTLEENQSGDIVALLAEFSGEDAFFIELQLRSGKSPWVLAQELGVLQALRDALLERVIVFLEAMVAQQQISREDADEMIALYEMYVPIE